MMDNTELMPNKVVWLAVHNRGAPKFNTSEQRLTMQEVIQQKTKLDPVECFIYHSAQFP